MRKSSLVKAIACFMAATMAVTCVPGANVTNGISIVAEAAAVEPTASFTFGDNGLKDSVSGKEATLTGAKDDAAATVQSASYAQNGALLLDGTYGIKLPDEAVPKGDIYTISYTVKVNASTQYTPQIWIHDKNNVNNYINIGRGHKGEGSFMAWSHWTTTSDEQWGDSIGGTDIQPVGEIHNYTVVVEGKKISIYCDGRLRSTDENNKYINGNNSNIYIGVNRWDATFKGEISNINIYNTALTEADICANLGLLPTLPESVFFEENKYFVYQDKNAIYNPSAQKYEFNLADMFTAEALAGMSNTKVSFTNSTTDNKASAVIGDISYNFEMVPINHCKDFSLEKNNFKVALNEPFQVVSTAEGEVAGRVMDMSNTTFKDFTPVKATDMNDTYHEKHTNVITYKDGIPNDLGVKLSIDHCKLTINSAKNASGKAIEITNSQIGSTDANYNSIQSQNFALTDNFDITIQFKNESNKEANYTNYVLVFNYNNQDQEILRADNCANKGGIFTNDWTVGGTSDLLTSEGYGDWDKFREAMGNADVTLNIKKLSNTQVQITAEISGTINKTKDQSVKIDETATRDAVNKNKFTQTVTPVIAGYGSLSVECGTKAAIKTVNYECIDNPCTEIQVVTRTALQVGKPCDYTVYALGNAKDVKLNYGSTIKVVDNSYDKDLWDVLPVKETVAENGQSYAAYQIIPKKLATGTITFECTDGAKTIQKVVTLSSGKATTIPSINGSTNPSTPDTDDNTNQKPDDNKDDNTNQKPDDNKDDNQKPNDNNTNTPSTDDNNNTSDDNKDNTTTTKKKAKITSVKAKRSKKNIVTVSGTVLKKATVKVTAKGKTLKTTANKKGKFSVSFSKKVSKKIKKNTAIKVVVTKSGYKKNTKNIKVK